MQNLTTPRLHIDYHLWAKAIGFHEQSGLEVGSQALAVGDLPPEIWKRYFNTGLTPYHNAGWNLNGTNYAQFKISSTYWIEILKALHEEGSPPDEAKIYVALMNHNLGESFPETVNFAAYLYDYGTGATSDFTNSQEKLDPVTDRNFVNAVPDTSNANFDINTDGFSIGYFQKQGELDVNSIAIEISGGDSNTDTLDGAVDFKLGGISFGKTYDFPQSADLDITEEIQMDGFDNKRTRGGNTISNMRYSGVPKWGNFSAFEQGDSASKLRYSTKVGRRSWKLSWSYLSSKKVLPVNQSTSNYISPDAIDEYTEDTDYVSSGTDSFTTNALTGTDFYTAVWSKTMGSHLPFLMQINKDNNNADQFAICRFKDKSLKIRQIAPNLHKISLTIEETW